MFLIVRKVLTYIRYRVMRDVLGYSTFEVSSVHSKPYAHLDELIQRCEDRKRRFNGIPRCPYCGRDMMFRHSTIAGGGGAPLRDDQGWKCVPPKGCCHTAHFGIPLTKDEFAEEHRFRGGYTITRPSKRLDERGRDVIMKRLKALGYLEFTTE